MTETPAGWYPDTQKPGGERYWDGTEWTEQRRATTATASASPSTVKSRPWWRPGWRKSTWAVLIWTVLMVIWLAGAGSAGNDCATQFHGAYQGAKTAGCQAGAGIAAGLIIVIWFLGYIPLGLIWFMSRSRRRQCPACGESVKRGRTACPACGHDFAAAARAGTASPVSPSSG